MSCQDRFLGGETRSRRSANQNPNSRRLWIEQLEDRRLLANVTVGNLNDVVNGTTTSIAALIATPGGDGISLREAILAANSGFGTADTIDFSVAGVIQLTNVGHDGEIAISDHLTINGPGAGALTVRAFAGTGSAGDGARIFNIQVPFATRTVAISGLTLTGGDVTGNGGAILNLENLTVTACTISGNRASSQGGGIANISGGNLTIALSTISGNTSGSHGGGVLSYQGSLAVERSTISGNAAGSISNGGGINSSSSPTTIDSSTISGNSAGGAGGIFSENAGLTITNSTISGNSARAIGGGIVAFSGLNLRHSTVTLNRSDSDNSGGETGGGMSVSAGSVVEHTIVAGNLRGTGATRDDISGPLTVRYCLIGDNTDATITNNGGNQIGTGAAPIDPLLGPLAPNGGPTLTHAFLANSPALDAGDPAVPSPPANDQRGAPFARVADGDGAGGAQIDIGAFEQQTTQAASLVVDTLVDENDGIFFAGDFSLREAISLANGSIGVDTITFDAALTSGGPATINLTSLGQLVIADSVTIDGPGADLLTIKAFDPDASGTNDSDGDGSRVFNIDDGSPISMLEIEIAGLKITGGDVTANGGGILNAERLTLTNSIVSGIATIIAFSGGGGGIYNSFGSVTVTNSTISGNQSYYGSGGGIYSRGGSLTVTNSTISGNRSYYGSGGGIRSRDSSLTVTNSTISSNRSYFGSGGVYSSGGNLTITNSTISGNVALDLGGGGIFSYDSPSTISHSTVTGNHGSSPGGGIYVKGDTLALDHTIVAGNMADGATRDDIRGPVSARFSLIGVGDNAFITDNGGNQIGTSFMPIDPMLGPQADNGGPTMTHALLAGSPAIDAGDQNFDPNAFSPPLVNDQRGAGFDRVSGGRIDIGAFEVQAVASADFDEDGDVDGRDFLLWQRGGSPDPFSGADLALWQEEYGEEEGLSAVGSQLSAGEEIAEFGFNNLPSYLAFENTGQIPRSSPYSTIAGPRDDNSAIRNPQSEIILDRALEELGASTLLGKFSKANLRPAVAPFGELVVRRGTAQQITLELFESVF